MRTNDQDNDAESVFSVRTREMNCWKSPSEPENKAVALVDNKIRPLGSEDCETLFVQRVKPPGIVINSSLRGDMLRDIKEDALKRPSVIKLI